METITDENRIGFSEKDHVYTLDGKRIYSTTQIIHAFDNAYDKVPERVLQRKSIIGTKVHQASEILDMGLEPEEDANTKPYLDAYRRFQEDCKPKVLESERQMVAFSDAMFGDLPYGMTIDRISEITVSGETGLWILDLKTSANRHMESWGLQLAAYRHGVRNWSKYSGKEVKTGIVHLKKTGTYSLIQVMHDQYIIPFHAAITTHNYFKIGDRN